MLYNINNCHATDKLEAPSAQTVQFDKSIKIGIQKSGASIRTLDVSLRLLMELGYE